MRGFKEKDFNDRLADQQKARQALLDRARKAAPQNDPEFAARQAERKRVAQGGATAIDTSSDTMIRFAKLIDDEARAVRQRAENEVEEVERQANGRIAAARFELLGTAIAPDATFTLRLSYGKVAGYTIDGKKITPFTTFGGLFDRATKAENKFPWELPKKWVDGKAKLKLETPYDFVSTNDIIGGNSGSPVINAKGELVGLIFDGNIQSLPGNFVYDDTVNRSVSVHSSALTEALRNVYDAGALAAELQPRGGAAKKRSAK